jgi:hypothetical protein
MADVAHGELSYLQLPARDTAVSARFYTEVFHWTFVPDYPNSFDTPGGLIGALDTDLAPVTAGGPVLWLYVADIHDALREVVEHGGRIVDDVSTDGPRHQATFADPAGNVLGAWQQATPS